MCATGSLKLLLWWHLLQATAECLPARGNSVLEWSNCEATRVGFQASSEWQDWQGVENAARCGSLWQASQVENCKPANRTTG